MDALILLGQEPGLELERMEAEKTDGKKKGFAATLLDLSDFYAGLDEAHQELGEGLDFFEELG